MHLHAQGGVIQSEHLSNNNAREQDENPKKIIIVDHLNTEEKIENARQVTPMPK